MENSAENKDNVTLLTSEQLAALLKISVKTIYRWVEEKRIPFKRCGRLIRFDLSEINRWLDDSGCGVLA